DRYYTGEHTDKQNGYDSIFIDNHSPKDPKTDNNKEEDPPLVVKENMFKKNIVTDFHLFLIYHDHFIHFFNWHLFQPLFLLPLYFVFHTYLYIIIMMNKYAPIISLGNISIKGNDIETSEYLGRSFCYMNNYTNDNTARRYTAHVNALGTTQIHSRNPYIIGWWSAAFPGFGHLLLSKYIHAFVLFIWEVVINLQANINLAIIYTFQGEFAMVKDVVDTRWLLAYMPFYLFGIWDSYHTTIDMNRISTLAEREGHRFNSFSIGTIEVNYL